MSKYIDWNTELRGTKRWFRDVTNSGDWIPLVKLAEKAGASRKVVLRRIALELPADVDTRCVYIESGWGEGEYKRPIDVAEHYGETNSWVTRRTQIEKGIRRTFSPQFDPRSSGAQLGSSIEGIRTPPCDKGCPERQRCADKRLACANFVSYTGSWFSGGSIRNIPIEERGIPSRGHYRKVYPNEVINELP